MELSSGEAFLAARVRSSLSIVLTCTSNQTYKMPSTLSEHIATSSYPLKLLITQRQSLLRLILEPISLAHIKPSLLRQCHCGIKVSSTLKLLPKTSIFLDLGKQSWKLIL